MQPFLQVFRCTARSDEGILQNDGWLKGTFAGKGNEVFFVKPNDTLPSEFLRNKDVFVRRDSVDGIDDLPELLNGDELIFELAKKPHGRDKTPSGIKPSAYKAVPLSYLAPRTWGDLKDYFSTTKNKVLELDTHYETVNSIMCCDAVWHYFFNVDCSDDVIYQQFLKELLDFILFLSSNGDMDSFPSRRTAIFKHIYQTNLLNKIHDVKTRKLIEIEYIRQSITFEPSLISEFLPALQKVEAESASPGASLFYDLLVRIAEVTNVSDWKSLNNIPTVEELSGDPLELVEHVKPVILNKGYQSTCEYLDVYYRLLRVETFAAIQKGIKDYKRGELDERDMNVYSMVTVVDINLTNSSLLVYLQFSSKNSGISWKTSRKLMYGNLLCISINGEFSDSIWVTVADRDEEVLEKHSVVGVELISFSNENKNAKIMKSLLYHSGKMVMVESPTYFKSFQYILESLKESQIEDFHLMKEIVHGTHEKYDNWCQEKSEKRWKNYLKDVGYDLFEESQKQSFWHALVYPLAIIQGPPGTGKTFIGAKLIQFLLDTQRFGILDEFRSHESTDTDSCSSESDDSESMFTVRQQYEAPILIMTYKNHALDELLKICTQFCDKKYITRIGRQSKEIDLESCLLYEKMKSKDLGDFKKVPTGHFYRKIENHFKEFEVLLEKLEQMKFFTLLRFLEKLTNDQFSKFVSDALKPGATTDELIEYWSQWKKTTSFKEELISEVSSLLSNDAPCDSESKRFLIADHLNNLFIGEWLPKKEKLRELAAFNNGGNNLFTEKVSNSVDVFIGDEGVNLEEEDEEDIKLEIDNRTSAIDCRFSSFFQGDSAKTKRINSLINKKYANDNLLHENFSLADFPDDCSRNESVLLRRDLWKISDVEKYHLIFICLSSGFEDVIKDMDIILEEINATQRKKHVADEKNKVRVLQTQKIVGSTITGASIHRSVIQKLAPKIVVIEESAEVLEASLVAVLSKSVEKLIMIGDHQQLKAQVDTHYLKTEYNFHISMMERLIKLEFPFGRLLKQGRMRPELSVMLKDIYPDYQDFDGLKEKNKPISCMPCTSFFWSHDYPEERERSIKNLGEANMVAALAMFFVSSNIEESRITILCAYRGQLQTVRRLYRTLNPSVDNVNSINIRTIDEYQGDENDFIIISLTRSNKRRNIGFLKEIERRCVAQSRAKCGMYFVGNEAMFRNDTTWMYLMNRMSEKNLINSKIPICCYKHPKEIHNVLQSVNLNASDISDKSQLMYFVQRNYGWCDEVCNKLFDCGIEEHRCKNSCTPRHNDDKCMADVPFLFESCGHQITRKCFMNEGDIKCTFKKIEILVCGHEKTASCYDWNYDKNNLICEEMCSKSYDCESNHGCPKLCNTIHSHNAKDCPVLVTYEIPSCKHVSHSRKICSSPIPVHVKCTTSIVYTSPVCGHEQKRLCSEKEKCVHQCQKMRPDCGHLCDHKCYNPCLHKECIFCEKEYDNVLNEARLYAAIQLKSLKEWNSSKNFEIDRLESHDMEYQILTDKCLNFFNLHSNSTVSQINGVWKVSCAKVSKKFWEFAASKAHGPIREELFKLSVGYLKMNEINDISDIYTKISSNHSYEFTKYASGLLTTLSSNFTIIVADVIVGDNIEHSEVSDLIKKSGELPVSVLLESHNKDSVVDKKPAKPTSYFIYDQRQINIKYVIHLKTSKKIKSKLNNFEDGEHLYHIGSFDLRDVSNPVCYDIHKAMALYNGDCMSRPAYHQASRHLKEIKYVGLAVNHKATELYEKNKNDLKKSNKIDSEVYAYHTTLPENVPNIIKDNLNAVHNEDCNVDGYFFSERPELKINHGKHCIIVFKVLLVNDNHVRVKSDGKGFCQQLVIKDKLLFIPMYVLYF